MIKKLQSIVKQKVNAETQLVEKEKEVQSKIRDTERRVQILQANISA